jgi:ribosomal-protein-alanine N-acetyltransferase
LEQIEARINQWQNERRNGSGLCFIIYNVERTEVIGSCHFSNIVYGPFRACHLGFSLSQAHQGQGFMYEALNAAITHVYEQLGLHRIMANYMPSNMRSGALLSRLGFVKEGLAPSYLKIAGRWQDHVLTSKLNPKEENDS